MIHCQVVARDPRHDAAVLQLEPNPFTQDRPRGRVDMEGGGFTVSAMVGHVTPAANPPRDGERIAVSGYPMSSPTLLTTSGNIATATATDLQEVRDPATGWTLPDLSDVYIADVAVNPGNSGGPVYFVETGEVLGVCVAFRVAHAEADPGQVFAYNSGLAVVVPIGHALALLPHHP